MSFSPILFGEESAVSMETALVFRIIGLFDFVVFLPEVGISAPFDALSCIYGNLIFLALRGIVVSNELSGCHCIRFLATLEFFPIDVDVWRLDFLLEIHFNLELVGI